MPFYRPISQVCARILSYLAEKHPEIEQVRCCIPRWNPQENTDRIKDQEVRATWAALPQSAAQWSAGDCAYSLCHNCTNIIAEQHLEVKALSLWELINAEHDFPLPDCSGMTITVQDCRRTRYERKEQDAVRSILSKCGFTVLKAPFNHGHTNFCGSTLYRPQPLKNPRFAPKHYKEQAQGLFEPHTPEQQVQLMRDYCATLPCNLVICCCHYSLEGLWQRGAQTLHLAMLIFPEPGQTPQEIFAHPPKAQV